MTAQTAADQINAAGAAMALLTRHSGLPAPTLDLALMYSPEDDREVWGLRLGIHWGLSGFEKWRQALDIDPDTIADRTSGQLYTLRAETRFAGVRVELTGFHTLPDDDTSTEQ
ncbi:hypothetical protein ACFW1A_14770 [Kitasatospora sp. NPDC058965]|uniref:hypothetical protein n=1 Tax=Kitasatospora sp. NPDC058965 TaxID=3346682 RepID=UPI00369C5226